MNTYQTIDPSSLTYGAYNFNTVTQDPGCFGLQYFVASLAQSNLPVSGLLGSVASALTNVVNTLANMGCAPIGKINQAALDVACPGQTIYGGPTGPVAPGAIQN